jgi:hypothetical protein
MMAASRTNVMPLDQHTEVAVLISGGLDSAVRVLKEAGTPLSTGDMVKTLLEKGYWQTEGKTPAATIYAAIITEISKKGDKSRFRTVARGQFELTEVGVDYLAGRFLRAPKDPAEIARRCVAIAPDLVAARASTLGLLVEEIRSAHTLYLIW